MPKVMLLIINNNLPKVTKGLYCLYSTFKIL
nr:MAG TPA: hypothetical protein [Bacteriophage sp.]DAV13117.1 MAG TPA: hypothetical protein [Bacteriophage sp.]